MPGTCNLYYNQTVDEAECPSDDTTNAQVTQGVTITPNMRQLVMFLSIYGVGVTDATSMVVDAIADPNGSATQVVPATALPLVDGEFTGFTISGKVELPPGQYDILVRVGPNGTTGSFTITGLTTTIIVGD